MFRAPTRSLNFRLAVIACAAAQIGCGSLQTATIGGKTLPRVSLAYTDKHYFWLTHRGAFPDARGPDHGRFTFGGALAGRLCGADATFDSWFLGVGASHIVLTGFLSDAMGEKPPLPWTFEVISDADGTRHVRGGEGVFVLPETARMVMPKTYTVDYSVDASSQLSGWVGNHYFKLRPTEGDRLAGYESSQSRYSDYVIEGIHALGSMPPADQAMILTSMLVCPNSRVETPGGGPVHGFALTSR